MIYWKQRAWQSTEKKARLGDSQEAEKGRSHTSQGARAVLATASSQLCILLLQTCYLPPGPQFSAAYKEGFRVTGL